MEDVEFGGAGGDISVSMHGIACVVGLGACDAVWLCLIPGSTGPALTCLAGACHKKNQGLLGLAEEP